MYNKIKKIFNDIKNSFNWLVVVIWLLINIASFEGSIYQYYMINFGFLVILITLYFSRKIEMKRINKENIRKREKEKEKFFQDIEKINIFINEHDIKNYNDEQLIEVLFEFRHMKLESKKMNLKKLKKEKKK